RRSGDRTRLARTRLYSAATFSSPSRVRIAQAHALGPCTSTPLRRAMPPRRIFSSRSLEATAQSLARAFRLALHHFRHRSVTHARGFPGYARSGEEATGTWSAETRIGARIRRRRRGPPGGSSRG